MTSSKEQLLSAHNWWRRLASRIWRYDFFISYHWDSGAQYAIGLAQRLRSRKFDCFLDRTDFAAGDIWVDEGRLALRHARTLILVGTREAILHSKPVRVELELFTKRNQRILPICFGRPIAETADLDSPTMRLVPSETIWIIEDEASLLSSPTQGTVDEILRSSKLLTSRRLRTMIAGSVMALLSMAVVLVSIFAIYAQMNAREARHQADVQLARRLTSEAVRLTDDREQVATLLVSHALGIMERSGESLPAAQRALRRLLPEKSIQELAGLGAEEHLAPRVVDEAEMVNVSSKNWKVQRDTSNPLTFHFTRVDADLLRTIGLTGVSKPFGLTFFTFSNDSRWLVTEGLGVRSELWDLNRSKATAVALPIETLLLTESAISPDSRWLASFGQYTGVSLWDLTTPSPTSDTILLNDHSQLTSAVAFSSDLSLFATGSSDDTVCVYRLRWGKPMQLFVLRHHSEDIDQVVFSPSGRWLVTRDSSQLTVLWDLQSPSVQSTGVVIDSTVPTGARLFFSEDHLFIERVPKGDFKAIPLDTHLLLREAAELVGRNLSHPEWDEFFPDMSYQRTFVEHPEGEPHPQPEEIF